MVTPPSTQKGLKQGQIAKAALQAEQSRQAVQTESLMWGRQPGQLAAAQLAIMVVAAAKGEVPDTIDDRLKAVECGETYLPKSIGTVALRPEELSLLPAAQTFVGLIDLDVSGDIRG